MSHSRAFGRPGRPLAALAAATALVLAGCGDDDANDTGATDAGGGGGGEGCETLTVWHYWSQPNQEELMTQYETMFEEAHPEVDVENVYVPYDQMNSKLTAAAGAQQGPDVVIVNGAETATVALTGALASMDDYWSEYDAADQFPTSVIHRVDDQIYTVQGYVNLLGLWYNADILDEIGVEPPTTLDELEAAMAAAKDAGHMGITLSGLPNTQGEWQAYPWLTAHGFDFEAPDAQAMSDAFAMARGWVEQGYLSPEVVTWDQTVPFQRFAAGGLAFAENGNWQLGTAEADAQFEFGVVPLPLGDDGKVYLGGEGQGIGAFSECPDLAWQYLTETFYGEEGQLLPPELIGSIPSRLDAAQDEVVTGNERLEPFAQTIEQYGANYPAEVIPPEAVNEVQLTIGQAWSAVLGGQQSPEQAAEQAITTVENAVSQ